MITDLEEARLVTAAQSDLAQAPAEQLAPSEHHITVHGAHHAGALHVRLFLGLQVHKQPATGAARCDTAARLADRASALSDTHAGSERR